MDLEKAINILELNEFAGIEGIKKNFRRLAHLHHPDKNVAPDAGQHFNELVKAYQFVLNNIELVYQKFELRLSAQDEVTVKALIENTDDIFDDIFGFSKNGRVLGYQEAFELPLTIEELARGAVLTKKMTAYETCETCHGLGAATGAGAKICTYCFGRGMVTTNTQASPCPKCRGRGRLITAKCESCDGFGRLKIIKRLRLTIPVGLKAFDSYCLTALEEASQKSMDVFVRPVPLTHAIFKIANYDLLCQYYCDLEKLGSDRKVAVQTPLGQCDLVIPRGTKSHDVITVKNGGLYKDARRSARGDLKVTILHRSDVWYKRVLSWFD